jgi:hypothetical protein
VSRRPYWVGRAFRWTKTVAKYLKESRLNCASDVQSLLVVMAAGLGFGGFLGLDLDGLLF